MQTVQEPRTFWNDIFICYSEADELFAEKLAKFLKHYHPPAELKEKNGSKLKVVKDAGGLNGTQYQQFLEEQFRHSRKLIVICSPVARKDEIVNDKIRRFAQENGAENIIPVLIDGFPEKEAGAAAESLQALPESLCQAANHPSTRDYSGFDIDKNKFHKGAYEREWYTLLSQIYGIERTEMAQLDRNQRFKEKRRMLLGAFCVLLLTASFFSLQAWKKNATENARQKDALAIMVTDLLERSRFAYSENDLLLSLHLAAEAAGTAPDESQKTAALAEALRSQPAARLEYIMKHDGEIIGACFNKAQDRILTWSNDSTARLWHLSGGSQVFPPLRHKGWVYGAMFTGNEAKILTWSSDSTVQLWDAATGKAVAASLRHSGEVNGVIFNRDETRLLSWCNSFRIYLWDTRAAKLLMTASRHSGWINGALFTADESQFFTWSDDSTTRRWDTEGFRHLDPPLRHKGAVNGLIFNNNFSRAVTWSNDSTARIWETATGRPIGSPLRHNGEIIGACFNKAQTRLLTWSGDNSVRLWNLNSGKPAIPPLLHEGWVLGATFNRAEDRVLTWSHDNSARLWDAASGRQIGPPMQHSSGPLGNDAGVFGAAFDEAETRILTWGDDNTARLWDIRSGSQSGPPLQHNNGSGRNHEVEGAIFHADFSGILTWSSDSSARYWKTSPAYPAPAAEEGISPDLDFPAEKLSLQVQALTGTEYHHQIGEVQCMEAERWRSLKAEYLQFAREHYRDCKYPRQNLWARFFPNEANSLRPLAGKN